MVILDTGCANLFSVTAALHRLGYQPIVSHDAEVVLQADKLFLFGVSTRPDGHGPVVRTETYCAGCTQPVLNICLGMQLLGTDSDENGGVNTLGIIDAPVPRMADISLPCPYGLEPGDGACRQSLVSRHRRQSGYFYFVHGYASRYAPHHSLA